MIFILSAEMNLTDVFLVKIKILSPIMLPSVMSPDAQCVSDKDARCSHLSQAAGSNDLGWGACYQGLTERGPLLNVEHTGADS